MKEFLKKLVKHPFVKVFSFNGIIIFGKLLTSFIVSKISAIYLGPSGYAIVGNLKNVLQSVLGVSANGFQSGLIKYIAEHKDDKKQIVVISTTTVVLSVTLSIITGVFIFIFSNQLSVTILKNPNFGFVFKYLAFFLPCISLNFLIIYIANGLQKFRLYTILISLTNFLNAILTFILIYYYNLKGALIASLLVYVFSFIISLLIKDVRLILVDAFINLEHFSIKILKSMSVYIGMAIYSTILVSLTYLLIRNNIISILNTETAGLWEAVNKISSFYMIFFSSLFTLYLLPLLASNKTMNGYLAIMFSYFKFLIPFAVLLFLTIFFFRTYLIKIFLTNQFASIEEFFYLQLFGDFIKIIGFSMAYQFHAKKMVVSYVVSDALLYLSFYLLSVYFLKYFNLQGVFYAYIVSVLLYLILVSVFLFKSRNKYFKIENSNV